MTDTISLDTSLLDPVSDAPDWLIADLRSDHAGETGAVFIYRGILKVSRDSHVIAFANEHLAVETKHLEAMDALLRPTERSIFLPLWRVAGFLTGFVPALFGSRAVFATIDAVETFVDEHYQEQLDRIAGNPRYDGLVALLEQFREDEVHHRDDARGRLLSDPSIALRAWAWMVDRGSKGAVALARFK